MEQRWGGSRCDQFCNKDVMVSAWLPCHFISFLLMVTDGCSHSKCHIIAQQSPEAGEERGCVHMLLFLPVRILFSLLKSHWPKFSYTLLWTDRVPPKFMYRSPILKVMVFGGGAFLGGWLGYEGEVFINGISALTRKGQKAIVVGFLSTM